MCFARESKTAMQDGRLYLTNYRVVYVDNESSNANSGWSLHLRHIRMIESHAGFLTSSPKISVFLFPKERSPRPGLTTQSKWICDRCTYHNPHVRTNCEMCDTFRSSASREIITGKLATAQSESQDHVENIYVKFSFRSGGHGVFSERLQLALNRKAWEVCPDTL
jgi:hypothetical protein